MYKLQLRRKGRPRKYSLITCGLDMFWVYTPACIGKFAALNGLLDVICPGKEAIQVKLDRARINLVNFRQKRFPAQGDQLVRRGNRWYRANYGWRWHGYESEAEARTEENKIIRRLFRNIEPTSLVNLEGLSYLWDFDEPAQPKIMKGFKPLVWRRVYKGHRRRFLVRRALAQGFSLDTRYPAVDWLKIPPETEVDCSGFARIIPDQEDVSISKIIHHACTAKLVADDRETTREYRRALYQCARQNNFVEFGNRISTINWEPVWPGEQWIKALERRSTISSNEV